MERAEMMVLHEGMTCEPDAVKRTPYERRLLNFIYRITDTPSKKMVRNIKKQVGRRNMAWNRSRLNRATSPII
jgi:hypothetical protein